MSFSKRKSRYKQLENKYSHLKTSKKNKLKKKRAFLRFLLFASFVIYFASIPIFKDYSNYYILNPIKNSKLDFTIEQNDIHSTEKGLSNELFLNTSFIGKVNINNSEMEPISLSDEMPLLTRKLKNLSSQYTRLKPNIFVWDYVSGNYVDIRADKEIPSASIIKIPLLIHLLKRFDANLIDFNEKMTLTDHFVTSGSGFLQYKPIGSQYSITDLTYLMIRNSDNSATNMLLAKTGGMNDLNRALRNWGFSKSHLSNWLPDLTGTNLVTVKDIGTMLYNLDNSDFLSLEARVKATDILSKVKNRYLIEQGLPNNANFIHKTGDIGNMLGDAGIVTLPDGRKYIVVIMVQRPWNSYTAKQFIIDASETIYNSYYYYNM